MWPIAFSTAFVRLYGDCSPSIARSARTAASVVVRRAVAVFTSATLLHFGLQNHRKLSSDPQKSDVRYVTVPFSTECATENPPQAKFCFSCGTALGEAPPAPSDER